MSAEGGDVEVEVRPLRPDDDIGSFDCGDSEPALRPAGPARGAFGVVDTYTLDARFGGALGRWLQHLWTAHFAHGSELVDALPHGTGSFPADALLRAAEEAGWIRRATPEPHPTHSQAFFGIASGPSTRRALRDPRLWPGICRTWWGWEPVRERLAYASYVYGETVEGPEPPLPSTAVREPDPAPVVGDPARHTRTVRETLEAMRERLDGGAALDSLAIGCTALHVTEVCDLLRRATGGLLCDITNRREAIDKALALL